VRTAYLYVDGTVPQGKKILGMWGGELSCWSPTGGGIRAGVKGVARCLLEETSKLDLRDK
jgi:hypothetical protein